VPVGHIVQARSADVVPGVAEEPGWQFCQAKQALALVAVVKKPLVHTEQLRSLVGEAAGVVTNWPATQLRCTVQAG
jgi:hypothetical protein